MVKIDKFELLIKAARAEDASEMSETEVLALAELLWLDDLTKNFSEKEIREYKDRFSGQKIIGMKTNYNAANEVVSFSFIPHEQATLKELYDGLIFLLINPAARNLAKIFFWLMPSDYVKMSIAEVAGWNRLADTVIAVKEWSKYVDIVANPGEVIAPFIGGMRDTSNLLVIDSLFSRKPVTDFHEWDRYELGLSFA